jgi:hypothetical protein
MGYVNWKSTVAADHSASLLDANEDSSDDEKGELFTPTRGKR